MQVLNISIRYLLIMTVILGGIYPLAVTLLGQMFFPFQANGSLVMSNNRVIGSELLSQEFKSKKYFWPRPSASNHSSLVTSATQRSVTSERLKDDVLMRMDNWGKDAPVDLLYASASGLDPHVSPLGISLQKQRIIKERGISEKELDQKIIAATEERVLGFMGQPRVNVLKLNLSLDNH